MHWFACLSPLRVALLLVVLAGCRTGRNYPDPLGPRYDGVGPVVSSRASVGAVRLVSFNIAFAQRVDSAIALLQSDTALRDADVILLQEMDAAGVELVAGALGMAYVYYPAIYHKRTRRDFGNAILSRWRIVEDAKLILPHTSRYARTQRTATAATICVGDVTVRLYSTHLGTVADVRESDRVEQLRAIIADATRFRRVVIGGDMNDSDVGRVAQAMGYAWPTASGPPTTRFGRWDHIFLKGLASPDSGAAGTIPDAHGSSDHRPVWAIAILRDGRQPDEECR